MSPSRYTPFVGSKFYSDGTARTFPGNTIICFVDPHRHANVFQECVWAQEQLQGMQCRYKFSFLPPDSFHMTVFELLCDQVRTPQKWSRFLPLSASLEETDRFFLSTVSETPAPAGFRIRYRFIRWPTSIEVEPADQETALALQNYRNRISEITGVRFPDHDSYRFHITLAYPLIELEPAEQRELLATFERIEQRLGRSFGTFDAASPQLVFFDDMFKFVPEGERHMLTTRQ
jgi:hypothetical protein